ncbi:MAG: hypothetical protein QIT33_gp37 [Methanophagales virus PBV300]|uniref:Uncharacterized protein n=1 Tax=Methanophagales virus PBV300 TaxID=2987731 RepID=A0ABY6GM28_9VIRU|nr:MAG: hypothetical protein QIT33_gp37 [Methanophagales virus PBV300]UYL64999.1 MAG: hypothetical protein JBCDKDKM_00037 [Methanophagales virus PBV300]
MSKHLSDMKDFRMKEKLLSLADMCATAIIFILSRYKNPYGIRREKAYLVYREDCIIKVIRLYPRK